MQLPTYYTSQFVYKRVGVTWVGLALFGIGVGSFFVNRFKVQTSQPVSRTHYHHSCDRAGEDERVVTAFTSATKYHAFSRFMYLQSVYSVSLSPHRWLGIVDDIR